MVLHGDWITAGGQAGEEGGEAAGQQVGAPAPGELVARGASPAAVFAVVAREVAQLLHLDYTDLPGSLAAGAREAGLNRTAGAPIIVDGRIGE